MKSYDCTWPRWGRDPHMKRARPRHAQSGVTRTLPLATRPGSTSIVKSKKPLISLVGAGSLVQGTAPKRTTRTINYRHSWRRCPTISTLRNHRLLALNAQLHNYTIALSSRWQHCKLMKQHTLSVKKRVSYAHGMQQQLIRKRAI